MKLNKEQIEDLKSLKKHPGYKILEAIEEEATNDLGKFLLTSDLSDEKTLEIIKKNQTYIKARQDFFKNTDKHLQEIYSPMI